MRSEFLRRVTAQESLIDFTEYTFSRYRTAPHHRTIAGQLERIERGEIDRLMLLVPPRHGKSELASHRFPAWYLGRQPDKQFLSVSATEGLASDFGRAVRNTICSAEYRCIFEDTTLAEDSQAKGKWHTSAGGVYYSLGIGGSVLGRGGDCILIDDPYSSMADALSELTRKNVWDWYTGTAYNRLMPGGKIIVINHRMHEDDLCGQLLAQQAAGGDRWEVVELPAITEDGSALWPDAYPIATLERIRLNSQARFWSALYMQRPTPDEGDYFKVDWLKPYDKAPASNTLRVYGGSDYAVTTDGGDYTVHAVVGIDPEGRMYLLDLWRKQASSDVWIEAFCDLVIEHKPIGWAEETGQIKAGVGPWIERRQRERKAYVYREQFPTRGDKAVRAQSMRGRMALDGLYVPVNAAWYPAFRSELLSFPAGKHDDQCVAEGTLISMADGTSKPIEAVVVGDLVATPIGACTVEASAVTNEAAQVYRVRTADGCELAATGNHPVFVEGKGFTRVDALGMMDQIRLEYPLCVKSLNTAGFVIEDIQTPGICTTADTFTAPVAAASCIVTSGRMLSDRFREGIKSIISMGIRPITISAIWNVFPLKSIAAAIQWLVKVLSDRKNIWNAFATRLVNGIEVLPGLTGMPRMVAEHGTIDQHSTRFAFAAGQNSKLASIAPFSARAGASSAVQVVAFQSAVDLRQMAKPSHASAVIDWSLPSGRNIRSTAPRRAGCVIAVEALSEKVRVRNLTVNRAHVYYANGMLVHNCDAIGLVGQLLDRMMSGEHPMAPEKPENASGYRRHEGEARANHLSLIG